MRRAVGLLDDAGGSVNTALMVNFQQEGEWGTNDLASYLQYPVQMMLFECFTVTEPGSEAVG